MLAISEISPIVAILQEASENPAKHRKIVHSLLKLSKVKSFQEDFMGCLLHVLQAKKDVGHVDIFLKFIEILFVELASKGT